MSRGKTDNAFERDLSDLLSPADAFDHPNDVVNDPDLTLAEKRAILASWASDACALEAVPALRKPSGARRPLPIDDIFDALRELDRLAASDRRYIRMVKRSELESWRRQRGGGSLSA
jgi:hypothetical protein